MTRIAVVAASAGGVETLREGLIEPLLAEGHQVAVTLTPTAATWLDAIDERRRIEAVTGLPVRSTPRLPSDPKPHPKSDVLIGAPLTANSVAKLALGIADNQALTVLCECVATVPMIIFPRVNAAHARQPAWTTHLERLRSVGVELIYGEHVWPLVARRLDMFTVDLVEDLVRGLGPDEGLLAVVPAVDEGADLGHQVADGGEAAAADGLAFDDAEPDLDQVQP